MTQISFKDSAPATMTAERMSFLAWLADCYGELEVGTWPAPKVGQRVLRPGFYHVDCFLTHPDEGNDDNMTGCSVTELVQVRAYLRDHGATVITCPDGMRIVLVESFDSEAVEAEANAPIW